MHHTLTHPRTHAGHVGGFSHTFPYTIGESYKPSRYIVYRYRHIYVLLTNTHIPCAKITHCSGSKLPLLVFLIFLPDVVPPLDVDGFHARGHGPRMRGAPPSSSHHGKGGCGPNPTSTHIRKLAPTQNTPTVYHLGKNRRMRISLILF